MANKEECLFEYTFAVFVDKISLKMDSSFKETIEFKCDDLFPSKELEYAWLKTNFKEQSKAIPGNDLFMISRMKESEMIRHLDDNPLKINLFHKDTKIGSAFVDLSVFFKSRWHILNFSLKPRLYIPEN